jgi:hypothetical protein
MNDATKVQRRRLHRHRSKITHVLGQRAGIPYELERRVCEVCGRELELRTLKRALAA